MNIEHKIDIQDTNFDENVIEKSKTVPVLVDFWASWCMPCQILKPILEKLTKDFNGKFILAEADADENPNKAREYNVVSIPSVKLFKDGEVIGGFIGIQSEEAIKQWLNENLN